MKAFERHHQTDINYQTFADLVFCALVAFVFFIVLLALEVDQRVRGDDANEIRADERIEVVDKSSMTREEIENKLDEQTREINKLTKHVAKLRGDIEELSRDNKELLHELAQTNQENSDVRAENQQLLTEIERLRGKKSGNDLGGNFVHVTGRDWLAAEPAERALYCRNLLQAVNVDSKISANALQQTITAFASKNPDGSVTFYSFVIIWEAVRQQLVE